MFAADVGLDWRLLHDIEAAKRTSFKRQTLAAIEVAYQWQQGSIQSVLDGGEPVPVEDPSRRGAGGDLHYDDSRLQYVADTPDLPVPARRALVELTRILLAQQEARQDRPA